MIRQHTVRNRGSPAHAGIDLRWGLMVMSFSWFPRTRGDRPGTEYTFRVRAVVPPHTRG